MLSTVIIGVVGALAICGLGLWWTSRRSPALGPMNREEFRVGDPADLILQASTQLSRSGRADLAAKAMALSHEARKESPA